MDTDGNELLPALDNHAMGTSFEELIRRFATNPSFFPNCFNRLQELTRGPPTRVCKTVAR
jgi:hypothetical protein